MEVEYPKFSKLPLQKQIEVVRLLKRYEENPGYGNLSEMLKNAGYVFPHSSIASDFTKSARRSNLWNMDLDKIDNSTPNSLNGINPIEEYLKGITDPDRRKEVELMAKAEKNHQLANIIKRK